MKSKILLVLVCILLGMHAIDFLIFPNSVVGVVKNQLTVSMAANQMGLIVARSGDRGLQAFCSQPFKVWGVYHTCDYFTRVEEISGVKYLAFVANISSFDSEAMARLNRIGEKAVNQLNGEVEIRRISILPLKQTEGITIYRMKIDHIFP